MQIHLSRPGGQREGPYTVEQINSDLAANKYRETDYWAWYEGLEGWVPLHAVPGILPHSDTGTATSKPVPPAKPAAQKVKAPTPASEPAAAAAPQAVVEMEQPSGPQKQVSSGMPFEALKQIFIFTSGEGPATMQSRLTGGMLKEITGQEVAIIRDTVPRDVFGRCDIGERLRKEGAVPTSAWKAMSALKPDVVQQARDGAYRICVRTFTIETGDIVALFLFYAK